VQAKLSKVARVTSLSPFGLAFAASGYCLSSVLYHAEFGGLPSQAQMDDITKTVARLVDGRWKHSWMERARRLVGISKEMMLGHPRDGGFGALDLQRHTHARWARWGMALAAVGPQPSSRHPWWARVAWAAHFSTNALLTPAQRQRSRRAFPTALSLLQQCGKPQTDALPDGAGARTGTLARLIAGLRALPPVTVVAPPAPQQLPANVILAMPLDHNPIIAAHVAATGQNFDSHYNRLLLYTTDRVGTVADLAEWATLHLQHSSALPPAAPSGLIWWWGGFAAAARERFGADTQILVANDAGDFTAQLAATLNCLPAPWRAVIFSATQRFTVMPPPTTAADSEAAHAAVIRAVGWRLPNGAAPTPQPPPQQAQPQPQQAQPQPLPPLLLAASPTVSGAYALQLAPIQERRAAFHTQYVRAALVGCTNTALLQQLASDAAAAAYWQRILRTAWDIRFENTFKVVMWRLSIDAVPHPGNRPSHSMLVQCHCGDSTCERTHHFYTCPVAINVFETVASALTNCPPLERYHIWLAHPPAPAIHADIWLVVCMAALSAMDSGRRMLHRATVEQQRRDAAANTQQTHITDTFSPTSPTSPTPQTPAQSPPLTRASAHAIATFWRNLTDFAALGIKAQSKRRQAAWTQHITPDHPFLGLQADGSFTVQVHD
jgi:hypothetical protein